MENGRNTTSLTKKLEELNNVQKDTQDMLAKITGVLDPSMVPQEPVEGEVVGVMGYTDRLLDGAHRTKGLVEMILSMLE